MSAASAVEKIIEDLRGRQGIGDEWDQIDKDIQEDIREKWIRIIEESYKPK